LRQSLLWDRERFQGVSLGDNIEKHAKQPLYSINQTHPHKKYSNIKLLTVNIKDKQLLKLFNEQKEKIIKENKLLNEKFKEYKDIYVNPLNNIKVADIECPCNNKDLYEKILPDDKQEVMAYKTCKHTIYAAAKRQMKAAPKPTPEVANDFYNYAKRIIDKEVGEELTHFGYSYNQWYNHLNKEKQRNMDIMKSLLNNEQNEYTDKLRPDQIKQFMTDKYQGICKVELQNTDGKPRMVCSIPNKIKYTMGPVTWKLEELFQDKLQGYCGGKNLQEMEQFINQYIDQGFTKVVEGDGSAFDNTQDVSLKEIDRYIYRRIYHSIHHVDLSLFKKYSQALTKTQELFYVDEHKHKKKLFEYTILGSVYSGDMDTTLMNTTRMALYNRYVNDRAGLVYGKDYIVFSKGDDFTVMYKPYINDEFINNLYYKYFLKSADINDLHNSTMYGLGQVLKFLDIGGPAIIKFCSLRAWPDGNGHIVLTRDPSKFLNISKYSIKAKTYTNEQLVNYLNEQALALEVSYKGIDYFDVFTELLRTQASKIPVQQTQYVYTTKQIRDKFDKILGELDSKKNVELEDPLTILLYDISARSTSKKMLDGLTYWENHKLIYNLKDRTVYTSDQLYNINIALNSEFDPVVLKCLTQ